ncbi:MAG: PEP-CTERM sorting domain-containing protein [Gammaproteobacteria bacterium]|nr:PEP-CTERM sorting domain-containing protein [Gammaproteobacteria bacterium]
MMNPIKTLSAVSLGLVICLASATSFAGMSYSGGSYSWSSGNDDSCYSNCGDYDRDGRDDYGDWNYSYDDGDRSKKVKVSSWSDSKWDKSFEKHDAYYDKGGYGSKDAGETDFHNYVDNDGGHFESVLYDYGDKCVVLEEISFTRKYRSDTDFTVFAYVGDDSDWESNGKTIDDHLKGKKYSDLLASSEWEAYKVYDGKNGSSTKTNSYGETEYTKRFVSDKNNDGVDDYVASKYWLVMAGAESSGSYDDGNKDYLRFTHAGGSYYDKNSGGCYKKIVICEPGGSTPPNGVPAPAPLALMAIGLLGLGYTRRRK